MRALIRWLVLTLVKLYYPRRSVEGSQHIPTGAAIFVANHPNGLLDPMLLRLALGREVAFLGKSTLFGNPLGRLTMESFGALPVYRPKDGADTQNNEKTFALCRQRLAQGGSLALFPEGTSHSDPTIKPLKTGAARIALSAQLPTLAIVPVGLDYDDKALFRSPVHVIVGAPLSLHTYQEGYAREPDVTVRKLTQDVHDALARVVVQAETRELKDGIRKLSGLTLRHAEAARDPQERSRQTQTLLRAYDVLRAEDPARLADLEREARRYLRVVSTLGIDDPWALETRNKPWRRLAGRLLGLIVLFPFAVVGALLCYGPYRLAGPLARRVSDEEDLHGTLKLLAGALCLSVVWLCLAAIATWFGGPSAGITLAFASPLLGYVALRFGESVHTLRHALRYLLLKTQHRNIAEALRHKRQTLAAHIDAALQTQPTEGESTSPSHPTT